MALRCFLLILWATAALQAASPVVPKNSPFIPEILTDWQEWALWGAEDHASPTPYNDEKNHLNFWPSRLAISVSKDSGTFEVSVNVFAPAWIALPGSAEAWPMGVNVDGHAAPVVEHEKKPSLYLQAGLHKINGKFVWETLPQRLSVPREIGLVELLLDGKPVEMPLWDANGDLWLNSDNKSQHGEKDFLSSSLYYLLEDGVPLILRTRVELAISGKNREEDIGFVLPEGWKIFSVSGNGIPVAVQENGQLKAQVRPGKWTIDIGAFRQQDTAVVNFADDAKPSEAQALFAFRARPDFRLVDISGASTIDASQTTLPADWRNYPVYRWETESPIRLEVRLRGMGNQKPAGLDIRRQLWLDKDGKGCTFHDFVTGQSQQIRRLDSMEGVELGAIDIDGKGQLITRNPATGAPGVEIRTRHLSLNATGRMAMTPEISASGWNTDAGNVAVTLNLPPGWRLFALWGADWVSGDWLTAWNLMDLFLLLIFTLAVFRLWGFLPALIAFIAFTLSYHEPGAPRYSWLVLLIPLALSRVLTKGWGGRLVSIAKGICILALLMKLLPFLSQQLQQTVYPQLERVARIASVPTTVRGMAGEPLPEPSSGESDADIAKAESGISKDKRAVAVDSFALSSPAPIPRTRKSSLYQSQNLQNDMSANIQTGPAQPTWKWRSVAFGWNGPVTASHKVRPILIPLSWERGITIVRIISLLLLTALLLDARRLGRLATQSSRLAVMPFFLAGILTLAICPSTMAESQIPDQKLLETLRERLLKTSTAYPSAAEIPMASLKIDNRKLQLDLEVHAALQTAVPIPGNLPSWSPLKVLLDGMPAESLRRADGFLWVVVPEGVHRLQLLGLLGDVTDWAWTFQLKPRHVSIEAPGWTVTGVKPNGVPEQQIFLSQIQKSGGGGIDYDNTDTKSMILVDRTLELGLVWQVHTTVTRKSPEGRAISQSIPLLPGENILTSQAIVKDGAVEVRLGARESVYSWDSELPISPTLHVSSQSNDTWTELWRLVASPVWNVAFSGLPPVFESKTTDLVPVWHPWPGESVDLSITRPTAVEGATVTVDKGRHEVVLGRRQRESTLDLNLRCSVGQDFRITLPPEAQVTSLQISGQTSPVRMENGRLVVPLKPGSQNLKVAWTTPELLESTAQAGSITLPVESSNISTMMRVPADRWILWVFGPQIGPALRFWGLLLGALIAAIVLARLRFSPLKTGAWLMFLVGLTQLNLPCAFTVALWFFLLSWRGSSPWQGNPFFRNILQLFLIGLTLAFGGIIFALLHEGLLGAPCMYIIGNFSSAYALQWTEPRCGTALPQPGCISVSIWWFRLLMLLWALWLASSMVRWLPWAWRQFSQGGVFLPMSRKSPKAATPPPPIPPQTP